jgi:predicted dienelactone hydrolase
MIRVLGLVLAMLAFAAPVAKADPVRLNLPAPTGKHQVGTSFLHLVDNTRVDTLAPTARPREVMVRLWYPAASSHQPRAGYLTPAHARVLAAQLNALAGTNYPDDLLTFPTHSRTDAPVDGTRHPVVLLSHGHGTNAAQHTGQAEELASRGYVVAAIDHTFDATAVEFPGGRVELADPTLPDTDERLLPTRVADMRFVLDRLTDLATGHNPDAEHRRLPNGIARALDLTRVAAVGHSLGSMTVVRAMAADPRIDAGVVLDGNPLGDATPLDRPVLMLGNQHHRRADDPDWAGFYDQLRGPRLHVVVDGAEHFDLTDITVLKETIDVRFFAPGPIDGARSLFIQRQYITAWLDQALRGRHSPLLTGESNRFPEVDFQP